MTRFYLTREWLEQALESAERAEKVTLPAETARVLMRAALELLLIEAEDDEDGLALAFDRLPEATRH